MPRASSSSSKRKTRLGVWFLVVAACWTILIAVLAVLDYQETYSSALAIARSAAGESLAKDQLFRRWASIHGGVYVPITAETPPNPHLANVPDRDLTTSTGKKLTLLNPAYMTRQIHELRKDIQQGVSGHITSLKPIRPENESDEWEKAALLAFERGEKEVSSLEVLDNQRYLRLMRPLATDQDCLKCHGSQGYQVGDIRGGLSVSVPWAASQEAIHAHLPLLLLTYGGLWAVGLVGLFIFRNSIQRHLSDLTRSEEALRQSERRFMDVLYASSDAILLIDGDTFVECNEATAKMLGYPNKVDFLMTHPSVLSPPTQPDGQGSFEKAVKMMDTAFKEGYHRFEWMHRKASGEAFPVEVSLTPISLQGRNILHCLWRDLTEKKRAKEELLQSKAELEQYAEALQSSNQALEEFNQIAETATRAKSEFLANMSHEIRTPMTAILGYADILLEENAGRATCEHIKIIKRNGEHLLGLINDILDLSKVEAGKMQIEPTCCSPFELLSEVVSLMRVRAAAKHLRLDSELVGPLPETIITDPLRLRQVLVNLVGNAIKFTEQGEVRIVVRLSDDSRHPRLRFDVTDTGIGMNEEQIGRLFKAFSQVDNSPARKFGGTGLGLCISKRLAEALGGKIEVESTPGKGSTFSVTIDPGPLDGVPMTEDTQEALLGHTPAAVAETPNKIELHGRVLLAEDGPDNQRLIGFLLEKAGAEVTVVENGQVARDEALAALARGEPFDVILIDMQMPVMDGYMATRQLREQGYTGPIIALTAHAMAEDRQKCLDAGCDDYATKPVDRQKLLGTIAHHMDESPHSKA